MFKKLFMLFKIGRKLSTSGAMSSIYEIYNPPITIKILFFVIGFSLNGKKNNNNLSSSAKLCNALQDMGTTFIKFCFLICLINSSWESNFSILLIK